MFHVNTPPSIKYDAGTTSYLTPETIFDVTREGDYIGMSHRYLPALKRRTAGTGENEATVDENTIFKEATLRITGNLDFDIAIFDMFQYLRDYIPLDEIMLNVVELDTQTMRGIARVTAQGIKQEHKGVAFIFENQQHFDAFKEMVRSLKGDVVLLKSNNLQKKLFFIQQLADRMSISLPISLIVVRSFDPKEKEAIGAAFLFVAYGKDRFTEAHRSLLEMLRKPLTIALANARKYQEIVRLKDALADDNRHLQTELRKNVGDRVVGANKGLRRVMETALQVAETDSPVLLLGDTGTGKEVIANAIHRASKRSDHPFVAVNCGAIPDTLIDSELFGHEKGAFTGANVSKRGRFERAQGGTLFLDEIGELTPAAQARLLRVLQNKEIDPIGGTRTIKIDVRTIAATHRDLRAMVRAGEFREDLFFRLNVFPIVLPRLRERREDIFDLTLYFIERKAHEMNLHYRPVLAEGAVEQLEAYDWPGNVRELQNVIERALILSRGNPLCFPELEEGQNTASARPADPNRHIVSLDEAISRHIRLALEQTGGRLAGRGGAAELLEVNPSTLRAKIRKLGVRLLDSRPR